MTNHSFIELLVDYYSDFLTWKEQRSDLSPISFNREYGLSVRGPTEWPYHQAILAVSEEAINRGASSIVIIYASTAQYEDLSKIISNSEANRKKVFYLSWQEIFAAMQLVNNDARMIQSVKTKLSEADLVFFVGAPPGVSEVVDQVRAFCEGCLIIFG